MTPLRAARAAVAGALLGVACHAPPPPVGVVTAYGEVRAGDAAKAEEVAALLEDLAPRVRDLLPGTHDRDVDVWVQDVLRSSRYGQRAEGVKGFTLLADEFEPRRIHLLEEGELAWYLAHELVHAQLDASWRALPGLLEEGLGDVVAERLSDEHAHRIRCHRLFTASGFTGGLLLRLVYRPPGGGTMEVPMRLRLVEEHEGASLAELLALSRRELRRSHDELPEPFYGISYLLVSRIVDRHGFDGLLALCRVAEESGHAVVPPDWTLAAAGLGEEDLDAHLLAAEFGHRETRQLLLMQPEAFGRTIAGYFRDSYAELSPRDLLYGANPCLRSADGRLLRLRSLWPVRRSLVEGLADAGVPR